MVEIGLKLNGEKTKIIIIYNENKNIITNDIIIIKRNQSDKGEEGGCLCNLFFSKNQKLVFFLFKNGGK